MTRSPWRASPQNQPDVCLWPSRPELTTSVPGDSDQETLAVGPSSVVQSRLLETLVPGFPSLNFWTCTPPWQPCFLFWKLTESWTLQLEGWRQRSVEVTRPAVFQSVLCYLVALCCGCLIAQSCLTLCDPMACSPPGFSVHGHFPGKNTGVGCHALLQGIFPTQGSKSGLPHCKWILHLLSHLSLAFLASESKGFLKKFFMYLFAISILFLGEILFQNLNSHLSFIYLFLVFLIISLF